MLSTARAIVVDDNYAEVQPVIKALARLGIGSIYLSGDVDEKPAERLHGIRLAVLDMDLYNAGLEPEQTAGQTLEFLDSILVDDSNPLMVIVWTGSEEVYRAFRKQFRERFPKAAPGIVCRLKKSEFNLGAGDGLDEAKESFESTIVDQLALVRPLDLFWSWEQAVHDAASRTTSAIAEIIGEPPETHRKKPWGVRAQNVLAALARASAGQQGNSPEKLLDDLCAAFEPLLLDRLEHKRVPNPQSVAPSADLIFDTVREQRELSAVTGDYKNELKLLDAFRNALSSIAWTTVDFIWPGGTQEMNDGRKKGLISRLVKAPDKPAESLVGNLQLAKLNGMIHWSGVAANKAVRPGNLYRVGDEDNGVYKALTGLGLNVEELRKDTLQGKAGDPVLVEATPICDYAQRKWKMPRFIAGFLVTPSVAKAILTQADYIRAYGPLWYRPAEGADGQVQHLILNAHFVVSVGMEEAEEWEPVRNLRRRTLTDLQVWLSSQHMRQGLLDVSE